MGIPRALSADIRALLRTTILLVRLYNQLLSDLSAFCEPEGLIFKSFSIGFANGIVESGSGGKS